MTSPTIYLIGSLRNPSIPALGVKLRERGYDIFDDWFAAGPEADDKWQSYENARGRDYPDAVRGLAAQHVFGFDRFHLDRSQAAILVLPGGKSSHLELGYIIGQGKPGFVLFDHEPVHPERWDVMYQFAQAVCFSEEELVREVEKCVPRVSSIRSTTQIGLLSCLTVSPVGSANQNQSLNLNVTGMRYRWQPNGVNECPKQSLGIGRSGPIAPPAKSVSAHGTEPSDGCQMKPPDEV